MRLSFFGDFRNPLFSRRRLSFFHPQIRDAEMAEIHESRVLYRLPGAIHRAPVDDEDFPGRAGAHENVIDMAAHAGETKHLADAVPGQFPGCAVTDFSHIRSAGTGKYQSRRRAARASGIVFWHDLSPFSNKVD
jgi:hypothetical protein